MKETPIKPAHPLTAERQARVLDDLDFSDRADFDDARRGFIGTIPDAHITKEGGDTVWSLRDYAFIEGEEAPLSVNPSLWRLSRLNMFHGLFQVTERIYQVRGFDTANITFIEGETGLVIIDPLTFEESARAALALYTSHRGERPIAAVIYSHSHRDHYGGVRGVITDSDVRSGRVEVIAPAGFMEAVVSEAVLAGVPMRRRSLFQFGTSLAPGPRSHVDSGLGKAVGRGRVGLIAPTKTITQAREHHVVDGVQIIFHLTPGTEAPAEMNFFFPKERALNLAENACHTMHNLCPLRGAKTRDALDWACYLDEALNDFVPSVDVVFAQHHWPIWGQDRAADFVSEQRDMYRYLHDQTLRLISHGLTPREIAEQLMMPNRLSKRWHARGYYGAVAHNVHAIYTHYLGPYDGNPANLHPLTPEAAAKKYVDYMGGIEQILKRARADFDRGEFRWVVQVLKQVVFARPDHREARELAADAMEQLGYQTESATWRNAYLLGARELREGAPKSAPTGNSVDADVVAMLPVDRFLEYLAIRVNGPRAQDLRCRFDWMMIDEGTSHRITLSNGALSHSPGTHGAQADAVIQLDRNRMASMMRDGRPLLQVFEEGQLDVTGNRELVRAFLEVLDEFSPVFNVVEP
ncbi:MAG: hypothetical protein A2V78_14340 [Betaproteobacteria bacterium RBG_16_64_18]|nr:MAG: hypothetical protein A2V78_14340 [Betaproteobacteria bacterium RBG_16_64_18]OGA39859.1 MAG: hypothetical protein A3G26_11925 [Betaproteobacteria bacterium RIFCSPLOWO2_12_FULL_65_110]